MVKMRLFWIVVLLLVLPVVVLAQDAEQKDQAAKPDPRLDQKVTYQAKEQFLYKVFEELTEKTGVTMTCGKNDKDWQVRETKVNIFIKDMPLKDLHQTLAKLLHYTWTNTAKDEVISYRLYQDQKSKKEEESLRTKAREAAIKKRLEKRKKALDDLDKAAALSDEEVEKLKEESPLRYFYAKETVGKAMAKMLKAVPEARLALLEDRELSLPVSELSPEAKETVTEFKQAFKDFAHRVAPAGWDENEISGNEEDSILQISSEEEASPSDNFSNMFLGSINVDGAFMPLLDADNPLSKLMGKVFLGMSDGDTSLGQAEIDNIEREVEQMMAKAADLPDAFESTPDDPDLVKVIKLELNGSAEYPALLEEIAKKAELQIISDCFEDHPVNKLFRRTDDKLESILKGAALTYGKLAKKSGKIVTCEDRYWFEKRAWAVPEEWMERWQQLAKDGNLQLDDLADMVCFTDEQIKHTICKDNELSQYSWTIDDNKDLLRLYAVLSNSQKKALLTEEGLDPASFSDKQWAFYSHLAEQCKINLCYSNGQMIPMTFLLEIDSENKSYEFSLIIKKQNAVNEEVQYPIKMWSIYLSEPDWGEEVPGEVIEEDDPSMPIAPGTPTDQPDAPLLETEQ